MLVDLEPMKAFAKRHHRSTKRMRRELEAVEAAHAHVLGRRRIVVQRRPGGKVWVDRIAMRMLEQRHHRSTEGERIRVLEALVRELRLRVDEVEAAVAI